MAAVYARPVRDKPTLILLVRHGLTPTTGVKLPGRAPGLHLSDEGRRQADEAAARIGALPKLAAVYSSPLERARETALAIARARHLAVRVERGLLEIDIGEFTGLSLKKAAAGRNGRSSSRTRADSASPEGNRFSRCRRA
jgi:probable phosphoglycerate mutase